MSRTIRISDESAHAINELGGAFDSPDDVIKQIIREAGYENLLKETHDENKSQRKVSDGGYTAKISGSNGKETEIGSFSKQSDVMEAVVRHLIDEYDLLNTISIPYIPPRSRNHDSPQAVINDNPTHPNGREMNGYRELEEGYYLHTGYDKEQKKARLEDLANECSVSISFQGEW